MILVVLPVLYLISIPSEIEDAFIRIRRAIGEIPILAAEQKLLDAAGGDGDQEEPVEKKGGAPKVLADGTYATETALSSAAAARLEAVKKASKPPLRCAYVTLMVIIVLTLV